MIFATLYMPITSILYDKLFTLLNSMDASQSVYEICGTRAKRMMGEGRVRV